jgi:hypothetical protein
MIKKIQIAFGISLLSTSAFAQVGNKKLDGLQFNTITTALPFMSITPDSKAGALGDAGTAMASNAYSMYWNTSALNFAKSKSQVGLSYTPWLRGITNDINLSYLSGYSRFGKRHVAGGSLRFFSLGEITFTDNNGAVLRTDKPSEYEFLGGYALKLAERISLGVNGKFAYSNLTGGFVTPGAETKPGTAGAADISFTYYNDKVKLKGKKGIYTFATTINNIGNKVSYSSALKRDFIPTNLKIGNSYKLISDDYNAFTFLLDFQKLLVPTPPTFKKFTSGEILSGKNNNVGVIQGMLQSFGDAPGFFEKDGDGKIITDTDGEGVIKKGSKFREELREINIAFGTEYSYRDQFFVRTGLFLEHPTKGNRRFVTFGFGLNYKILTFDLSYIAAAKTHPLANTWRFSLLFNLNAPAPETGDATPE